MSVSASTRPASSPALRRALLVLPPAVLVTGGACTWAAALAPAGGRAVVLWFGVTAALLLSAATTVAAYGLLEARRLKDRLAGSDAQLAAARRQTAALAAEADRLADETLPALVKLLRDGASADHAAAEVASPSGTAGFPRLLRAVAREMAQGERMRAAAMSACASAAGRVQALATSMLADLRDMEDRYDGEVLGDLLKLDHTTAQAGRLADSIAVLTGGRSGRRWTRPIAMESILRGAVGRINAYQRVRLHNTTSTVAVAGHAAEGVMHALAELMDNAANFSPPTEEVHVYVEELTTGVVVTIEDGGLVMSPEKLARAKRAVSAEPLDLATLSGTRLGLPVVGCLARKHGLTVSFRPSSRGGTGAVVLIPQHLITEPRPADSGPAPRRAPAPRLSGAPRTTAALAADSGTAPVADPAPAPSGSESNALPKRTRGQTLAAASRSLTTPQPKPATRPRTGSGDRFGAFRKALRGGSAGPAAGTAPQDDEQ